MSHTIRIGIAGYGNLGRGVEASLRRLVDPARAAAASHPHAHGASLDPRADIGAGAAALIPGS